MARNPITLAERYRRRAEELRVLAEEMTDGDAKAALLHAARSYDELAQLATAYDLSEDPDATE